MKPCSFIKHDSFINLRYKHTINRFHKKSPALASCIEHADIQVPSPLLLNTVLHLTNNSFKHGMFPSINTCPHMNQAIFGVTSDFPRWLTPNKPVRSSVNLPVPPGGKKNVGLTSLWMERIISMLILWFLKTLQQFK